MKTRFKPDPRIMADLLRAAELIDCGEELYCCGAFKNYDLRGKGVFEDLYKPTFLGENNRYCGGWMACRNESPFPSRQHNGKCRRVLALLLTREIYRNGDHIKEAR